MGDAGSCPGSITLPLQPSHGPGPLETLLLHLEMGGHLRDKASSAQNTLGTGRAVWMCSTGGLASGASEAFPGHQSCASAGWTSHPGSTVQDLTVPAGKGGDLTLGRHSLPEVRGGWGPGGGASHGVSQVREGRMHKGWPVGARAGQSRPEGEHFQRLAAQPLRPRQCRGAEAGHAVGTSGFSAKAPVNSFLRVTTSVRGFSGGEVVPLDVFGNGALFNYL